MYQSKILRQLVQLWRFRGFVLGSVKRELQIRYGSTVLGAAWVALNPLAMIFVYTVIFGQLFQNRIPGNTSSFAFGIYLCAGILTWGLFSEIMLRGQTVFLDHANLIKKVNFPRICLPSIVALSAIFNFAVIFGLFTCFLVLTNSFPGWVFLSIAPVLVLQLVFSLALGTLLGVLNVFFRDVAQFSAIVLQFWFWLTPIVYPASILPDLARSLLVLNPMAAITAAYQEVLVSGKPPQWETFFLPAVLTLVLCVLAVRLLSKRLNEMVDEL